MNFTPAGSLENKTFNEIQLGDSVSLKKRLTLDDIRLFAIMSGDVNPAHMDSEYARDTPFHEVIAHGMWGGALLSRLLGTELPGPGTIYLSQSLNFHLPVKIGDEIEFKVSVVEKLDRGHQLVLDCVSTNQVGDLVISGTARVKAPIDKIVRPSKALPGLRMLERRHLSKILEQTRDIEPIKAAIVHPVTAHALRCVVAAVALNVIRPTLIGPENKIRAAAAEEQIDISEYPIVDVPHSHAAAEKAVELIVKGEMHTLVKGSLHTDELLAAVLSGEHGLRTDRRISHIYVFDVPTYDRLLMVTDAAINIAPNLEEKVDIVQNAIDFAQAIGIETPRVALLSAVEMVTSKIPSTTDAASLCKMADRKQIKGGILDGPLAFDNAISATAAQIKEIDSPVAGVADIFVVPNLESGNMMAKQLEYLADAHGAGLLLGAKVPIVLTSRADSPDTTALSCALAALLYANSRRPI